MTSQVMQATSGALQATALITSLFTFLVLMISALALNAEAAAIVLSVSLLLFGLLRPLRAIGVRRARALSQAQMHYAGGISEAIRVAEETQVFGVAAAQRARIDGFVEDSRRLFLRTQVLVKLVPNLYQSLIYLLFVVGLFGLYIAGAGHAGALGAVVLLLVRAAQYGQQSQASYQGLSQSLPFIERTEDTALRYIRSAPAEGRIGLSRCARSRSTTSVTPTGQSVPSCRMSASRWVGARRSASSAPPARASRRSCRSCSGCALREAGAISSTASRRSCSLARTGSGWSPTFRRSRA